MIQPILFFILGFLCATFLAVTAMPAIWRRALRLTRLRVEAALPLSLAEIQADKDRIRAQYAMAARRLEMTVKALRTRAAEQAIEIERVQQELKRATTERPLDRTGTKEETMKGMDEEKREAIAALMADRDRIEARLTALPCPPDPTDSTSENIDDATAKAENAALREEISDLAARMVAMVASNEGADSPIAAALSATEPSGSDAAIPSLAGRVQALRKAVS